MIKYLTYILYGHSRFLEIDDKVGIFVFCLFSGNKFYMCQCSLFLIQCKNETISNAYSSIPPQTTESKISVEND